MQFRKDINGLRAFAVIAVVLFHFESSWMPGGFSGVDVFFVISGFLMTGIIFRGIEQDNFSILKFYVARANRIVPALAVLCLVLLVFGWFYLIPHDYQTLGNHVGSSVGFFSNIIYWQESGYFDVVSREKWLLHTWSLSVEWQFYMLYPLALVAMRKFMSLKAMKLMVLTGAILGFIFCVIATYRWPVPAYYLLPTRAWEMMLGGVAYLYPFNIEEKKKKLIECSGVVFILGSFFLISKETPWPGYLALIPVFGAFLIIQAQRNDSFITGNPVCQKIGSWSYSIYLWHWPLVVFGYYFDLHNWVLIGLPLSVSFGWLSFKFIEKLKFKSFTQWSDVVKVKPIYFILVVGVLGGGVYIDEGKNYFYKKLTIDQSKIFKNLNKNIVMSHRSNGYCFYDFNGDKNTVINNDKATHCVLGERKKQPNTLFFGSSFAGMYDPLLDIVFKNNHESYNSVSTNWCSPFFTNKFTGPKTHISYQQCLSNRAYLKQVIRDKRYKTIILADTWNRMDGDENYLDDLRDVMLKASKNDINVIIMPTPISYYLNPINPYYRQLFNHEKINISKYETPYKQNTYGNKRLEKIAKKNKNVYFIKRSCLFNQNGLFTAGKINIPYSLDGDHISKIGSVNATDKFINSDCYSQFQNLIKK